MTSPRLPSPPQSTREKRPRNVDIQAASEWHPMKDYSPSGNGNNNNTTPNLMSFSPTASSEPIQSPQFAFNSKERSFQGSPVIKEDCSRVGAVVDREAKDPALYGRPSTSSGWEESERPSTARTARDSWEHMLEKSDQSFWSSRNDVPGLEGVQAETGEAKGDGSQSKEFHVESPQAKETFQPPPTTRTWFTPREMVFIFNICLAQLMALAGLAQTIAPMALLSKPLRVPDPGVMVWPTAAYALTFGACILPAGRLGDLFGHKRLFLSGWVWFSFFSILCGFSSLGGAPMLTGTRAVQGIGAALLVPNGLAILGRSFPVGAKINLAISLFNGFGPIGLVLGAVFSCILAQLAWWPWVFWTTGVVGFLISTLTYVVIPSDDAQPYLYSSSRRWQRIDFLGATTGVGGLIFMSFAVNQAPIDGWSSVYIGILLGAGVILMAAFFYIELRLAENPLIPLKSLNREAALTLSCIAAGWSTLGIWSYYMFLLLQQVRAYKSLGACALFWPVAIVGPLAALAVSPLLKKISLPHLLTISLLAFLIACLTLATMPAQQTFFANTLVSVLVAPFGMAWSFPAAVMLMSRAVPREHQGLAASLVSTVLHYSISIGLGLAGSVDRHVGENKGLFRGYRGAWYLGVGLGGLGVFLSLFIWLTRAGRKK